LQVESKGLAKLKWRKRSTPSLYTAIADQGHRARNRLLPGERLAGCVENAKSEAREHLHYMYAANNQQQKPFAWPKRKKILLGKNIWVWTDGRGAGFHAPCFWLR